ncbi:hypothetical protein ONZ51_g6853 [Trametes cubensis]|uniref:Heterokaryon incompatibility domain-containing protein n=1 Tax=Trametes cubensis TaxID=1111947 RepID=A0AAD7TTF6_9APHY|nr:hypothetical protein ONZ51_g6853 [Trametes cubensis]
MGITDKPQHPSRPAEGVHLSWLGILTALNIEPSEATVDFMGLGPLPVEVTTDDSDAVYVLYKESLRYLERRYPPASVDCALAGSIADQNLLFFPECVGILVNLVADVLPITLTDVQEDQAKQKFTRLQNVSTLAFIIFGWKFTDRRYGTGQHWHISCALKASPGDITTQDLYQALFLDSLHRHIQWQHFWRNDLHVRSPMPWSFRSVQELSKPSSPEPTLLNFPVFERFLPSEDSSLVRNAQWALGLPMDLPWYGAEHDGHSFCATLGSYTDARRAGEIFTLREDSALWLGALTFGLLEALTHMRIPESALLVDGTTGYASKATISGTRILRLLLFWAQCLHFGASSVDPSLHLEHGRQVASLLQRALSALDEEAQITTSMLFRSGIFDRDDVLCALAMTITPLCRLATKVWDTLPEMDHLVQFLSGKVHPSVRGLVYSSCLKRARSSGWCPYVISELLSSTSRILLLTPILLQLAPFIRTSLEEHKQCEDTSCVFHRHDDATYVPRHTTTPCSCTYIRPPLSEVHRLLAEGHIPVTLYDGITLHVLPADDIPYVAISHVWAEGMGSTTDDGLPTCVVKRLSDLARRLLPEHGAFWIDSLSVPKQRSARKHAIKLMADTYRKATKVLVIDDSIRAMCSISKSPQENLLRIAASAWVRRVWTLQEGLLARKLYFEFVENPVDFEEMLGIRQRVRSDAQQTEPTPVLPWAVLLGVPILAFRMNEEGPDSYRGTSLSQVTRLLQGRSTTKAEDELVAISSLLPKKIDMDRLLAQSDGRDVAERRMREFLLQLRDIPKAVPLGRSLKRLELHNFTWAPCTLVKEVDWVWDIKDGTGICTEDGFLAEYFVVSLINNSRIEAIPFPVTHSACWGIRANVYYQPSMTAHFLFGRSECRPPSSIDTLLFLKDDFPTTDAGVEVPCAAACTVPASRGFQTSARASGMLKTAPRLLKFAGPCFLTRQRPFAESLIHMGMRPAKQLGKLQKTWVFLT